MGHTDTQGPPTAANQEWDKPDHRDAAISLGALRMDSHRFPTTHSIHNIASTRSHDHSHCNIHDITPCKRAQPLQPATTDSDEPPSAHPSQPPHQRLQSTSPTAHRRTSIRTGATIDTAAGATTAHVRLPRYDSATTRTLCGSSTNTQLVQCRYASTDSDVIVASTGTETLVKKPSRAAITSVSVSVTTRALECRTA